MKVRFVLSEIATRRGFSNPYALSKASGLNYAVCYKLWHEQINQITFPTLARLCEILKCSPGDLLAITKDR